MPEALISFSCAILARKYPLSDRSVPTMDSATWCRTPAAVSAGRRLRSEVLKNSSTALSSNEGELARSITTCAPAMASLSPSPVMVLTPVLGEAATTSWPPWRRMATVFEPIRPVPPMTTIFMVTLRCRCRKLNASYSSSIAAKGWWYPSGNPKGIRTLPTAGIPACWLASSLPASENLHKTFAASHRNAQFARTRRICSFIRVIRQDESPRQTVQYPRFGGRRLDFGSLIASGSDPSGTSDPEFFALRPYCQRVHGQRSLLASLGQNSTGALVPSSPSLRLLRTYPDIGARTP